MTRTIKAMACAAAAAAILGGSLIAAEPSTGSTTVQACVMRAQESGFCVIPGRRIAAPPAAARNDGQEMPRIAETVIRTAELRVEVIPKVGILPMPEITGPAENAVTQTEAAPYTEEELEILACCIYCEAGGDSASDETRRMVGEVVINRVADPRFPDTILGVLTQKYQYGLFWRTGVVWPARAAHEPEAVERAYDCARLVLSGERLLPEDVIFQAEFVQGEIVASAPGFYFCR